VQIFYDILKYVLKFTGFADKIIFIMYWDILTFRSVVPHKVDPHNNRSVSQWNGKGELSEDSDSIVASIPQQRIENNTLPMDSIWRPQTDTKIISPGPAICSIAPSPAGTRPANPSL
jgi:hypothetical protein